MQPKTGVRNWLGITIYVYIYFLKGEKGFKGGLSYRSPSFKLWQRISSGSLLAFCLFFYLMQFLLQIGQHALDEPLGH